MKERYPTKWFGKTCQNYHIMVTNEVNLYSVHQIYKIKIKKKTEKN